MEKTPQHNKTKLLPKYAEAHSKWTLLAAGILRKKYVIKEVLGEPEEETKLR